MNRVRALQGRPVGSLRQHVPKFGSPSQDEIEAAAADGYYHATWRFWRWIRYWIDMAQGAQMALEKCMAERDALRTRLDESMSIIERLKNGEDQAPVQTPHEKRQGRTSHISEKSMIEGELYPTSKHASIHHVHYGSQAEHARLHGPPYQSQFQDRPPPYFPPYREQMGSQFKESPYQPGPMPATPRYQPLAHGGLGVAPPYYEPAGLRSPYPSKVEPPYVPRTSQPANCLLNYADELARRRDRGYGGTFSRT